MPDLFYQSCIVSCFMYFLFIITNVSQSVVRVVSFTSCGYFFMSVTCVWLSALPLIVLTCSPLPQCKNNSCSLFVFVGSLFFWSSVKAHAMLFSCHAVLVKYSQVCSCSLSFLLRFSLFLFKPPSGFFCTYFTLVDTPSLVFGF